MIRFKIAGLILLGLSGLCYYLPSKSGNKKIGIIASILFSSIILITLIGNFIFSAFFVWPIILAIQIIFIIYWIFILLEHKTLAKISATVLSSILIVILLWPWIIDWTFSKSEARQILSQHNIYLKDDFKILENESGGFTDYVHTFTLKISESDYSKLATKIRVSENFAGLITDFSKLPMPSYAEFDTVNYETKNYIKREYYTEEKKPDGTYHFIISLSKKENTLHYFGINE